MLTRSVSRSDPYLAAKFGRTARGTHPSNEMTPIFAGKTIVVTGASRGLGRHVAERFWALGANLVLVARDGPALESLSLSLRASAIPAQGLATVAIDVAGPDAAGTIIEMATTRFDRLDVLICNAAIQGPIGPLWSSDAAAWRHTIEVNLIAPAMLAARASAVMVDQGSGTIMFLAGGGATAPRPNFSAYATAKTGIVRLAETLAQELEDTAICVNAISPGAMPTAMLREVAAAGSVSSGMREAQNAERVLVEGNTTMYRAVDLAVFLASDAARGITGKLISAVWDRYEDWPAHLEQLNGSDLYTLRRITGRDRKAEWGDK